MCPAPWTVLPLPAHRITVAVLCSSGTFPNSASETGMDWLWGHLSRDRAMSMALALAPPCPIASVSMATALDGVALHSCCVAVLTASSDGSARAAGRAAAGRERRWQRSEMAGACRAAVLPCAQSVLRAFGSPCGPPAVSLSQLPGAAASQVKQTAVSFS